MIIAKNPLLVGISVTVALALAPGAWAQDANAHSDESLRCWGSGEYLLHWVKDAPVSDPLMTVGDPRDGVVIGATNTPGERVIVGDSDLDYGAFSGGRLTLGAWLDSARTWGLEGSGFFLDDQHVGKSGVSSGGSPYLAIPLSINGVDQAIALSFTNLFGVGPEEGAFRLDSRSGLWGAEINGWRNLNRGSRSSWDLLVGFRHLELEEEVDLRYSIAGQFLAFAQDRFSTETHFYGLQFGTRYQLERGPWSLNVMGKVGLGANVRTLTIAGNGGVFDELEPGDPIQTGYGVFALPGNIGRHSDARFSAVPEVRLSFGYQATRSLRVTLGYDFTYWSEVARAGDQFDTNVQSGGTIPAGFSRTLDDYLRLIGPSGTTPSGGDVRGSGFWTQGLTFGVELSF